MRIRYWSSDVCSSDLQRDMDVFGGHAGGDMHVDEAARAVDLGVDRARRGALGNLEEQLEYRVFRDGHVGIDRIDLAEIGEYRAAFGFGGALCPRPGGRADRKSPRLNSIH